MLIHDYAEKGNIVGVQGELARHVDIESRDERDEHTPLMHAVSSASAGLDMVRFLILHGANPNAVGGSGKTKDHVLSLAVKAGDPDKIISLLDAGAAMRAHRDTARLLTPRMERTTSQIAPWPLFSNC